MDEEALKADQKRLANAQRLADSVTEACETLAGDPGGVVSSLASAVRTLEEAASIDAALAPTAEAVQSAMYSLQEAARELSRYPDSIEFDPAVVVEAEPADLPVVSPGELWATAPNVPEHASNGDPVHDRVRVAVR